MSGSGALYYIIPASVMHDAELEWSHKCIYGVIAGLAKREGYSWATNGYLAKLTGVSERQIQRIVQSLDKSGHIRVELDEKRDRKIYLGTTQMTCRGTTQVSGGYDTDVVPYKEEEQVKETGKVEEGTTTTKSEDRVETDGYILASALLGFIRRNKKFYSRIARFFSPEKEEDSLRRWAKDFDLLLTRDAVPYDEAVKVLKWCQKDEFWQGQILSGGNFRKHFDSLKHAMNGGSTGACGLPDENPEITKKIIEAYGWLINNSKWKPARYQVPKFIEAAERVVAFIDIHNDRGLSADELIGYLKNCLQEHYREKGDMVHPGNMNSGYTWDVLLPQYLENVIGAL